MSKNSLYLIIAIAIAVTAGTFFVSSHNTQRSCVVVGGDMVNGESLFGGAVFQSRAYTDAPPTYATVRGFPFWYYQEPLPAGCISERATPTAGAFSPGHLADDFLIWLGAAILLFLPSALFRWWRGPAMLGDNVRRR